MTETFYEPLSALDAAMVFMETDHVPMHVGLVAVFEAKHLRRLDGGLDRERMRTHMAGVLGDLPRHRQRLAFVPLERHPVWVDAEHFDLDHHVQFHALPRPGDEAQLKELVGRVISSRLDLERPLWEVVFVEGLEGDRFAMISKLHHCMVDGVAATQVFSTFFTPDPVPHDRTPEEVPPRPSPTAPELVRAEIERRAHTAVEILSHVTDAFRKAADTDAHGHRAHVKGEALGMLEALKTKVTPSTHGPLNPELVGKDRAFDWVRVSLDDVKDVKNRLGGKINDVVLAMVAGAVRRYFAKHLGEGPYPEFRVIVPFDSRGLGDTTTASGNRVVPTLARLPIDLETPRQRYMALLETTHHIKASGQVKGLMRLEDLANLAIVAPIAALLRAATNFWAGNLIVTNVPGPGATHYFLGTRMLACYPLVPIMANQALGIALFSYDGGLFFGFHADRVALPDLADLPRFVAEELEALKSSAASG